MIRHCLVSARRLGIADPWSIQQDSRRLISHSSQRSRKPKIVMMSWNYEYNCDFTQFFYLAPLTVRCSIPHTIQRSFQQVRYPTRWSNISVLYFVFFVLLMMIGLTGVRYPRWCNHLLIMVRRQYQYFPTDIRPHYIPPHMGRPKVMAPEANISPRTKLPEPQWLDHGMIWRERVFWIGF